MRSDAPGTAELLGRHFRECAPADLISAHLFGSHAAGRAHRESDMDVALLPAWERYPTAKDRFEARVRLGAAVSATLRSARVDLVVLNDVPPALGRRIVTTGQRVFCADPERDHAFIRDVQLRAADLDPFLRRVRRLKLEAIRR